MAKLQYLVADYYATGEGRTIMILITKAYPREEDYATEGKFEDGKFTPGILKEGHTAKVRAAREFGEKFHGYYLPLAENIEREEFMTLWGHMIPEGVKKATESDDAGNLNYCATFHLNFS